VEAGVAETAAYVNRSPNLHKQSSPCRCHTRNSANNRHQPKATQDQVRESRTFRHNAMLFRVGLACACASWSAARHTGGSQHCQLTQALKPLLLHFMPPPNRHNITRTRIGADAMHNAYVGLHVHAQAGVVMASSRPDHIQLRQAVKPCCCLIHTQTTATPGRKRKYQASRNHAQCICGLARACASWGGGQGIVLSCTT
jgi:hypothetical protein